MFNYNVISLVLSYVYVLYIMLLCIYYCPEKHFLLTPFRSFINISCYFRTMGNGYIHNFNSFYIPILTPTYIICKGEIVCIMLCLYNITSHHKYSVRFSKQHKR